MFEDVLDKFKDDLTESLVASGEAHRVHKILSNIEMNRENYLYFYEEGLKANQERLDKIYNLCNSKKHEVHWLVDQLIDEIFEETLKLVGVAH